MTKYLNPESVAQAFTRLNEADLDNKVAAICSILRILKTNGTNQIQDNESYKIQSKILSTFLDKKFSFDPKEYNDDSNLFVTFPKGYSDSIFKELCSETKIDFYDIFSVLQGSEPLLEEDLSIENLKKFLAIPEEVFDLWFIFKPENKPSLSPHEYQPIELKKLIHKKIAPDFTVGEFNNFSFSKTKKCNTVSNPGELKRGPYFQPLYGSFAILECIIVSSFNLSEKYQVTGSTNNQISSSLIKNKSKHNPLNLVFYGPPGTGKTRAAMFLAYKILTNSTDHKIDPEYLNLQPLPSREELDSIKVNVYSTQFHPSYSYEDFIEGLRPIQITNGDRHDITYSVIPGTFKIICDLAKAYLEPNKQRIYLNLNLKIKLNGDKKTYLWDVGEESITSIYRLASRKGKIYFEDNCIIETGLGFKVTDVSPELLPNHSGNYRCYWIYEGDTQEFIIFIDELNRGNPAKTFGEALSLIETTKRLGTTRGEATTITLPYSHENFGVPINLHIICSMNTADKSLTSLDEAFRRRFEFIYFPPLFNIVETENYKKQFTDVNLKALITHFEILNKSLNEVGISQESFFGQSYLIDTLKNAYAIKENVANISEENAIRLALEKVWRNSLHPQIRELVGDNFEGFAQELSNAASRLEKNNIFLTSKKDLINSVKEYLDDMRAPGDLFPWKEAA